MGDAGEGLIDAESRIQERMEDLERERAHTRVHTLGPEERRALEALKSLRLARRELEAQLGPGTHERRRVQIEQALAELDRRMAAVEGLTAEGVPVPTKG
jgi:hypothetical protein